MYLCIYTYIHTYIHNLLNFGIMLQDDVLVFKFGLCKRFYLPQNVHMAFEAHSPCSVGIDVSPAGEAVTGVTSTISLHPVSRSRMSGVIISTFLCAFMKWTGTN